MRKLKATIKGRVQGVWFRGSTQELAQRLSISGSATNLPDGSVEVIAYGKDEAIDQFLIWLHQGPELARVDQVDIQELNPNPPPNSSFTTG